MVTSGDPFARGAQEAPWEDEAISFPSNLVGTWWGSLLRPAEFYRGVPLSGVFARPLLYYLIVSVVSSGFATLWGLLGVGGDAIDLLALQLGVGARELLLLGFFLSPFYALALLTASSLLLQLFVVMLVPDHARLGATARVLCYAAGPSVLAAVPEVGGLVGTAWCVVLAVAGLREVHRTTAGRAVAIVLFPLVIAVILVVSLVVLLFAFQGILPVVTA